jgi:aryl-alcohol dehydrogenase-like predicted oxidoreductase
MQYQSNLQHYSDHKTRDRIAMDNPIECRTLGTHGPRVSSIGLGCMGMSEFYGTADQKESVVAIHHAIDMGITFFDTADMYGPYTNEELLGKAIDGKRHSIILATKFGIVRTSDPGFRSVNGRPEYVKASCEGSMKRLGVDHIDLYYQHRVDPTIPIEETVGAMADLVKAGKVRYLGLSEASAATIRRAHSVHPITALQSEYSLWSRDPEDVILPTLRELGIGLVPYSPLGRGFLTGRFRKFEDLPADDFRRNSPRFQGENFDRNIALVAKVETIAKDKGVTAGQIALAWVLAQGGDVVPIPGTTRRDHLNENIGATRIALSQKELNEIEVVLPKNAASGARYPEPAMKMLNL